MSVEVQFIGRLRASESVADLQILGVGVFNSFLFVALKLSIKMASVSQGGFPIQEVFACREPTAASLGSHPATNAAVA